MDKRILVFMMLAIFVSSCSLTGNGNNNPDTKKSTQFDSVIYHGTKGISVSFLNDITSGYEGETIESAFKFENNGAYGTTIYVVAGVDESKASFVNGGDTFSATKQIEGRDPIAPHIRMLAVPFALTLKDITEAVDSQDVPVFIDYCYDYYGELSTELCVDQDPANIAQIEKLCTSQNSLSVTGGQGGPVAVSHIEYAALTDGSGNFKPRFKIHIANQGPGQIRKPGSAHDACTGQPIGDDPNSVTLEDISFSGFHKGDFDCSPDYLDMDPVEVTDKDYFTCTLRSGRLSKEEGKAYLTDLYVKIKYGYQTHISKNLKVLKI